jgi:Fic family protein
LYAASIKNKPLIETNPYLKDPIKRRAAFIKTVISSSAIEGIHVTAADLESGFPEKLTMLGLINPRCP